MKLDTTTLPGATITGVNPSLKLVQHPFDYSNITEYTVMGSGPSRLMVVGLCKDEATRLAVDAACRQGTEKKLYFPSQVGGSEDRYYRVYTGAASWQAETAEKWRYTFEALTVVPWVYDAATGQPLSGQGAS